jgi:SAM-dependent methyltransferase
VDTEDIAWLRREDGRTATAEAASLLASRLTTLQVLDRLRRRLDARQARAAVALVEGRAVAARKLPDAERLICDRDAAEQATSELVARHTAQRFAGAHRVADLGCGMGGDALAIARHAPVLAVDADPARLAMVEANAEARALAHRVVTMRAEIETFSLPSIVDAVWLDPSRRGERGRTLDPRRWSPPLDVAIEIARRVPGAGIKMAPGIDLALLPADGEVEFISLDGDLVEAVLWLGRLVRAARRATVLPAAVSLEGEPDTGATAIREPGRYLYDPDPAVGRAGLIDALAERLGAWKLADRIAYLSSDEAAETPFARRFRVLDWLPFSERALLDRLRHLGADRVEVMRRGSPVDTNGLEVRLGRALEGDRVLTVALTRVRGEHVAVVCERER